MSRVSRCSLKPRKLASAIAAALAIPAVGIPTAHAQNEQPLEEITVTGSRIVRRDLEANSPIQTVDREAFESQSAVGLEMALNDLPQFVPAATGMTQFQDQSQFTDNFPTLTAGASTISLRGLGANRNLVLLDGYRAVPVNATMAVDLNSIPAAAVQRVEVITGGASSVYGADAVAGVVNFILKRDFEGIDFDLQYGNMQNGEGPETRASALFGVNSADGRGNIMLGIEWAKREPIHADDVDFYRNGLRDPTVEGSHLIISAPYYQINTANQPSGGVIDGIFDQAPANTVLRHATLPRIEGRVYWNDDGTLWTGGESFNNTSPVGRGATAGTYRYTGLFNTSRESSLIPGDYPYRKIDAEGQISEHLLQYEANIPLDRNSTFARAEYDVTDTITAYAQVLAVGSQTRRLWSNSPAVAGWGMTAPYGSELYTGDPTRGIPSSLNTDGTTNIAYLPGGQYGLNCEADGVAGCTQSEAWPVPPELAALLESRTNPNEDWSFNFSLDFANAGAPGANLRSVYNETRTLQQSFGLRGTLEGIDGRWDLVVSRGTSKLDVLLKGYASLESVRSVFTRFPNWGTGMFIQGNAGAPGNGFSGGVARCTSGMPVFRAHNLVSEDCLEAIFRDLNHQSEMDQKFVELNFEGHLVDMPAGEARFSAGVHSRENSYYYNYDPLQTSDHFVDNPMGFAASSSEGSTAVDEIYGELLLPLLDGKKAAQHLNLELGYRYSDYDLQGGVDTYKALVDWGITPTLRFRGGKQLATRAPNIAEMFQQETLSWYFSGTGDPCGVNSNATYGANPAVNPSGYLQARALCSARMGAIAQEYYGPGFPQPLPASWTPFINTTGTPTVGPEEADTWTAGFVWRPSTGREMLDGLQMSIDWYDIEITDMIAAEAAEVVYQACLSVSSNPTGDPNHPACLRVFRNPGSGAAAPTTVGYVNAAFAKVAGTDLTVDWAADIAGGNFGVNFMVTYLQEMKTQASPAAPVYDWKGSLGPGLATSLNNGAFDYRTFTTFRYGRGDWNLALRWRHLPDAIDGEQVVSPTTTQRGAEESYDVFDLTGTWTANGRTTLRFGIENLLDEQPVWTGRRAAGDVSPSTGSLTTEAGFYDILGRQYFVGVSASF